MGQQLKVGITLALDQVNKQGGVHNQRLQCIIRNDEYNPQIARHNIDALMKEDNVRIFPLALGSPPIQAALDLIREGSILMLFPISGAPSLRVSNLPGIVHMRASYRDEVFALLPYFVEKLLVKRFAFFYQNDAYGQGPLEVSREILKSYGIKDWLELPYIHNVTDFSSTVVRLKEFQPEAVGLFSTGAATEELLRQLGVSVLASMRLFAISPLFDGSFNKLVQNLGIRCIFSRVVPDPSTSDLTIAREYRNVFNQAGMIFGDYSFEAYIGINLLAEVMRSIKGPLTMQSVRAAFESMKQYPFKGFVFSFDPESRSLARDVWLDLGGGVMEKISWPERAFREKHSQQVQSLQLSKKTE